MTVNGRVVADIGAGLLVLLGVASGDESAEAASMARRCFGLRVFRDADGRMNLPVESTGGAILVVPNFTVCGDTSRGRRPSYARAAAPADAEVLFDLFCSCLEAEGAEVARGVFGAMMDVELVNDGPVTLILDS